MVNLKRITALHRHLVDHQDSYTTPGGYRDIDGRFTGDLGSHTLVMFGIEAGYGLRWFENHLGMSLDEAYLHREGIMSVDEAARRILGLPSTEILVLHTVADTIAALADTILKAQKT